MLPELVNIHHWRFTHQVEPLRAIADAELVDAFHLPAVRALVNYRWLQVKPYFYLQFVLYVLFLACMTAFSDNLGSSDDALTPISEIYAASQKNRDVYHVAIVGLILNFWFLIGELVEFYSVGLSYFSDIWNYFDLGTHIMYIVAFVLFVQRSREEWTFAAVTILLVWFKLLSFFRGFQGAGIFVRLVFRMAYEIRYFMLIWAVVLLGFANAYIMMLPVGTADYITMPIALVSIFDGAFQGLDLWIRNSSDPFLFEGDPSLYNLQLVVFVIFTLIATLLMLNLLIAFMGSVFQEVMAVSEPSYLLGKAGLILSLENLFFHSKKTQKSEAWLHLVAPLNGNMWSVVEPHAGHRHVGHQHVGQQHVRQQHVGQQHAGYQHIGFQIRSEPPTNKSEAITALQTQISELKGDVARLSESTAAILEALSAQSTFLDEMRHLLLKRPSDRAHEAQRARAPSTPPPAGGSLFDRRLSSTQRQLALSVAFDTQKTTFYSIR